MLEPKLGTYASFVFMPKFAALDGIYKLIKSITFVDALQEGMDFVEKLYTPAGLTENDFLLDKANYLTDVVLVLEKHNPENDNFATIYIPKSIIRLNPDPMLVTCNDFFLTIQIGKYDKVSQETLSLINMLQDIVVAKTGTIDSVDLVSNKTEIMSAADYAIIEADRRSRMSTIPSLQSTITDQLAIIQRLQQQIAYYENMILTISPP